MKKVLITHSYFYKLDKKQWKFKQPYPPLGTLLAAAVLHDLGHHLIFYDANLSDGPEEICKEIEATKPDFVVIYDDGFNYLTKMCLTVMRDAAIKMVASGAKVKSKVIVCSSDSADHYDKYLSSGADFVIKGEGEQTLRELITALDNESDLTGIQGLVYKSENSIKVSAPRPVLRDLDSLPMPAWDLADINAYRGIWLKHHGYFSLNIATTRGCPFKCNWCAKPIYGNRYNTRSPRYVVEEIKYLLHKYQPDHFWMCDDIFGLKPGWVQEFEKIVTSESLKFKYKIQSRVDLLLERDTIQSLAASGAETVWVGAESGSQKILDAMDKGTRVEQITEASRLLKEHNLRIGFFLQFGYLGEKKVDINETLKMVWDLVPDEIGISVSYPLPGTVFFDRVKSDLQLKSNWEDSDDLDLMFRNTYPPVYYKVLHRYVHSVHRIRRGMKLIGYLLTHPLNVRQFSLRKILSAVYHIPMALYRSIELRIVYHAASDD